MNCRHCEQSIEFNPIGITESETADPHMALYRTWLHVRGCVITKHCTARERGHPPRQLETVATP